MNVSIQPTADIIMTTSLLEYYEEKKKDPSLPDFVPPKQHFQRVPLPADVNTQDPDRLREHAHEESGPRDLDEIRALEHRLRDDDTQRGAADRAEPVEVAGER